MPKAHWGFVRLYYDFFMFLVLFSSVYFWEHSTGYIMMILMHLGGYLISAICSLAHFIRIRLLEFSADRFHCYRLYSMNGLDFGHISNDYQCIPEDPLTFDYS